MTISKEQQYNQSSCDRRVTHLHRGSALEVLSSSLNVLVDSLLGQVDHVAAEKRGAVLLEEALVSVCLLGPRMKAYHLYCSEIGCHTRQAFYNWFNRSVYTVRQIFSGAGHSPVKPWKKLLCAMVGVQHNGDAVERSDGAE